jgi:hypothetical protein
MSVSPDIFRRNKLGYPLFRFKGILSYFVWISRAHFRSNVLCGYPVDDVNFTKRQIIAGYPEENFT